MKKFFKLIPIIFLSFNLFANQAEWTFGAYMQGDNNLDKTLEFIINQMISGSKNAYMDPNAPINIIAQVDFQKDQKTWRFKITSDGKIEDGSISTEMGINPAQEIIDFALFLKQNFDAKKFALMLYNHGSGIEDYRDDNARNINTLEKNNLVLNNFDLKTFNLDNLKSFKFIKTDDPTKANQKEKDIKPENPSKGILYDDSENTCLTNPAMKKAFMGVKKILGHKLDLLILDACLMSMLEVHYQIKDSVQYCVSSQQIKYSGNWNYMHVLSGLILNADTFDALTFGNYIVDLYRNHSSYKERTASCINLSQIEYLKNNFDDFSRNILECAKYNKSSVINALKQARKLSPQFFNKDYIDLYTLYQNLIEQLTNLYENDKDEPITSCCGLIDNSAKYLRALDYSISVLIAGLDLFPSAISSYAAGEDRPDAHGLSIYFPEIKDSGIYWPIIEDSGIHKSYYDTDFAKECSWVKVLKLIF